MNYPLLPARFKQLADHPFLPWRAVLHRPSPSFGDLAVHGLLPNIPTVFMKAVVDGANESQLFYRIGLPLIANNSIVT